MDEISGNMCYAVIIKIMSIKRAELKERRIYESVAWRRVRLLALQRDNYLCRQCLRKKRITKATQVHHLKPIKGYPELALTLDNLESLCWDCHEQTKPRGRLSSLPVRVIKI